MHIDEMFPRTLTGNDLVSPTVVTITGIKQIEVRPNNTPLTRWIIRFKPPIARCDYFFLNRTIAHQIADATSCQNSDGWIGKPICLFAAQVKVKGKMRKVVRVRPAASPGRADQPTKVTQKQPPAPSPKPPTPKPQTVDTETGEIIEDPDFSFNPRTRFYELAGPAISAGTVTATEVNDLVQQANGNGFSEALIALTELINQAR